MGIITDVRGDRKDLPKKGLIYRDKETGKNVFNGRADFFREMDSLPTPAWDLINFEGYSRHVAREFSPDSPRDLPYIRLYTSRGCPFSCSFCQVPLISGHDVRRQSPKKILDELEFLKKTYGIKSFMNSDDNFLATKRSTIREFLTGMVERKLDMPWTFEDVGVMHLNEETVRLLAASNCKYMGYAVETGVQRISKEIIAGKPLKKEHTKKMMKLSKELGIFSAAAFIIGFPTETWDEIRETIQFAEELDADYTRIHILVPLKGTKMYEIVEEEGLLNERYDHFNNQATWKSGVIESQDRSYTSNDLTILKAMEWDRINFTKAEKRRKIADFLRISEILSGLRYSVPKIIARDIEVGLLLIEDLGDSTFSNSLAGGADEKVLYKSAVDVLIDLHGRKLSELEIRDTPIYDKQSMLNEVSLFTEWFMEYFVGFAARDSVKNEFLEIWESLINKINYKQKTLVLRDFHADNLFWLPKRKEIRKVGLIDFQDALIGDEAYDISSLLEDVRRDVSEKTKSVAIREFIKLNKIKNKNKFIQNYNIFTAQRNAKIVGIFIRLARRDNKHKYLELVNKAMNTFLQSAKRAKLKEINEWIETHIPKNKLYL